MKQVAWFDRKFDFAFEQNIFPSILERLEGTPILLRDKIAQIPPAMHTVRLDDQWSILENVGHLLDLESLWQGRLLDIQAGKEVMRSADLENTQTHQANHNQREWSELLAEFTRGRRAMVKELRNLSEAEVFQSALHPRLKTPMRVIDMFLFVAEHDDHHLARITKIYSGLSAL